MAECLCFISICADDCRSPDYQNCIDPVPKDYTFARLSSKLYHFIRDHSYESIDGKLVRRERDYDRTTGYDDVGKLFWYSEGIAQIVFTDKLCLSAI